MRRKRIVVFGLAVLSGGAAMMLALVYTQSVRQGMSEKIVERVPEPRAEVVVRIPTAPVVTVGTDLAIGHALKREDLKVVEWPRDARPEGSFETIDEVFKQQKSPILKREMVAHEVLLQKRVLDDHGQSALALMLPPGKRAVAIKVNEIGGVGGFVQPGDRVDVLLTESQGDDRASAVLLQNVQVLAIGQEIDRGQAEPKVRSSVTLAVSLAQAQKLALATSVGQLSLALRAPQEPELATARGVVLSDLEPDSDKGAQPTSKIQIHRAAVATAYTIPRATGRE